MDFANEHYIRVYTRDTTTWKRLGWDGQNVLTQVLRKVDWSGVLDVDGVEPWEAVVIHCGAPEDAARRGMARCIELGVLVHNGSQLVAPKFIEAQTTAKSDKQRQKESRLTRRAAAVSSQNVTESHEASQGVADSESLRAGQPTQREQASASQNVTPATGNVTECHDESQPVTAGHDRSLLTSSLTSSPTLPQTRAEAREGGVSFNTNTVERLFSEQRRRLGKSSWSSKPSDYDRKQRVVDWARADHAADPVSAAVRSLGNFFAWSTENPSETGAWQFWKWADDAGLWFDSKPAPRAPRGGPGAAVAPGAPAARPAYHDPVKLDRTPGEPPPRELVAAIEARKARAQRSGGVS